jgi:hypothetical protein
MPTPLLRPAPERFVGVLLCLCRAVVAQTGWGLSLHLIAAIVSRIQRIKHRFARLAARIEAGSYAPRSVAAPESKAAGQRRPPPPNKLPNFPGWLLPLETSAAACRGQLEALLQDAEMVALMAAAPAAMARVLRPLCRMLALDLPPALATRASQADPPPDSPPTAPTRAAPPRRPPPSRPAAPPPLPALTLEYVFGGGPRLVWN